MYHLTFIKFVESPHPVYPQITERKRIDLGEVYPKHSQAQLFAEASQVNVDAQDVGYDAKRAGNLISILFGVEPENLTVRGWQPEGRDKPILYHVRVSRLPAGTKEVELTPEQQRQLDHM